MISVTSRFARGTVFALERLNGVASPYNGALATATRTSPVDHIQGSVRPVLCPLCAGVSETGR